MSNKIKGLLIFLLFYVIAYGLGFLALSFVDNIIMQLFIFDLTATLIIYLCSLIIKNASLYDAYWSLTPMIMLIYLIFLYYEVLNIFHWIFIVCFLIWSNRLTVNWIITFKDINWIDWRYKMQEENHPKLYPLISFSGIMLMPTLLVFVGFIPVIEFIACDITALSLIGDFCIMLGVAFEFIADHEVHTHLKSKDNMSVCEIGLWKYSRHPNYLGEILIWLGVDLILFVSSDKWFLGFGFVAMIILFEIISIPMMEKRQIIRREGYKDYMSKTSKLLFLPRKQ